MPPKKQPKKYIDDSDTDEEYDDRPTIWDLHQDTMIRPKYAKPEVIGRRSVPVTDDDLDLSPHIDKLKGKNKLLKVYNWVAKKSEVKKKPTGGAIKKKKCPDDAYWDKELKRAQTNYSSLLHHLQGHLKDPNEYPKDPLDIKQSRMLQREIERLKRK